MRLVATFSTLLFVLSSVACSRPQEPAYAPAKIPAAKPPKAQESPQVRAIRQLLLDRKEVDPDLKFDLEIITTINIGDYDSRLLVKGTGEFFCGATGNCPHWVIRPIGDHYEIDADLGVADGVSMEESPASVVPDLLAHEHSGGSQAELGLYRFNGLRYKLVKCMHESYTDPENFDHHLEQPIVKEQPCGNAPQ